ncbi:Type II restriction enzyme, methylase subunit (fragment) [Halomonas sp. A3H3]|uniref:Eco57I restriction-modification methylase domain-containing protein n=1 Tax=Halomonas sp. A3H3 TaxID=1346287 RepID=UPI00038D7FFC
MRNPGYEFSVLPADILGQVYERFLGKVIKLSGKRAVIEEKQEVRRAGGVYYTPSYVVRYIVENTVGTMLSGRTPNQVSGLDGRSKDKSPLRIVDPACGSGSFLIGAYQYLLDWYLDQYISDGPQKHANGSNPKLLESARGNWRLTISERRRILLTHIYGVDIDTQAVEVTKLSLLLKVLEGETADAIARQMDFFNIRALPDLGSNIRCGNSLIGTDFYQKNLLSSLSEDDQIALNVFSWEDEFPFLRESGGFDCVIGNPPYLYSAGHTQIEYFEKVYRFSQYQTDFYVYFTEKGLLLLRKNGVIGYIIPDSWLNSDNFSLMRTKMLENWHTEKICTFGYKVFRDANIENTIFIARNSAPSKVIKIIHFNSPIENQLTNELYVRDVKRIGLIDTRYSLESENIIKHLDKKCQKLGGVVELNRGIHAYRIDGYGKTAFGSGPQTKRDREERSYHSAVLKNTTYLPEVRGRDVFWINYRYSGQYISYGKWLAEPRDPKFIRSPKVVFRKTLGTILSAAYIEEPAAVDQALYIAISKDNDDKTLKFVLGLAASAIGAWYLRTKYAIYDQLHPWYTKRQLEEFPVPEYSQHVVDIVERIIYAAKAEEKAKMEQDRRRLKLQKKLLQDELDDAVFNAFDLNDEQRSIIKVAKIEP